MEITVFVLLALALLVGGVLGSFVPMVPAGLLSIGGIVVYWWSTGYATPGPIVLAGFLTVGVLVVAVDYLAGAIAAKAGGASTLSSVAGALVGFALFFVLGPVGILLGITATVFALELYRGRARDESLKAAGYALVGTLGSSVMQFVLTLSMLVAFLVVLVV
ncbi:hypothetical protein HLRTI_000726 [Halorhabdus tiamatea SARL4B]|uniref:Conserved hypothetical membrane protein (DUF456) n=1 Tax=Halorhabdus tiamatea SARL4B TaxID=1033806 RepID=F7PP73_9EURY|nr:DUF456 domain-containing protein [Halorhabdus tiamatea]ERJ07132.1 hypothetical protein HLRTI_000726 [Halorhabdus tiamatea SARL4B]CCQ32753.1 conserved hypothetical membrane protein (DUF456) [Halorhabdus tiamatea SARL4B]